jgi:hypothetical protein
MTDLIGADLGLSGALSKHSHVPTTDQPQKAKDFTSDQEVRWCPGCGDYVILNTMRNFLPESAASVARADSRTTWRPTACTRSTAARRRSRRVWRWRARTCRSGWSPATGMRSRSVATT